MHFRLLLIIEANIMGGSRGGGTRGGAPPSLKNHKNIDNTGPDPLKNHIATKPAFNVGPSFARQRNPISMAFRWGDDYGPIKAVKKQTHYQIWTPLTKLSGSAHEHNEP